MCIRDRHSGSRIYLPDINLEYYGSSTATSSMETELLAIDLALQYCKELEAENVCILSDSKPPLWVIAKYKPTPNFVHVWEIHKGYKIRQNISSYSGFQVIVCLLYTSRCV